MVCSRILAAVGFYTLLLHTCCGKSNVYMYVYVGGLQLATFWPIIRQ